MTDTKHTPTPWYVEQVAGRAVIWSEKPQAVVMERTYPLDDPIRHAEQDAAHIVRCVNAHDELVSALHDMAMCFGNPRDADVDAWWEFRCDWEQGSDAIRYETLMRARAALQKVGQ